MVKDYSITVTVKNNYLLTKMRERGIQTAAELSRQTGVNQQIICRLLALKMSGLRKTTPRGEEYTWRVPVKTLAKFFNCPPEELFPFQHRHAPLPVNKAEIEFSLEEVGWLLEGPARVALPLDEQAIQTQVNQRITLALGTLTAREERVLRMRFGFDGSGGQTLEKVAEHYGVGRERIRQIEAKAIRKLKHPSRSLPILAAMPQIID